MCQGSALPHAGLNPFLRNFQKYILMLVRNETVLRLLNPIQIIIKTVPHWAENTRIFVVKHGMVVFIYCRNLYWRV